MAKPEMDADQGAGVRVLLVDDEPIVRSGLREMLAAADDVAVAGEASDPQGALMMAATLLPDVIVIEARFKKLDCSETIRELRRVLPDAHILVFTSYGEVRLAIDCIVAGADGYLLKCASAERLIDAIRAVHRGDAFPDPWFAAYLFKLMRERTWEWSPESELRLTPRDNRMLTLVAAGKSNREIAADLNLAEQTVKNQLSVLLHRLGIARRVLVTQYLGQLQRATY
jgi:DNA-binding NarL/FixJ family response regulator